MTRYNVKVEIDLTVEADTYYEAIEQAICDFADCGYYMENEVTQAIKRSADVSILEDVDY